MSDLSSLVDVECQKTGTWIYTAIHGCRRQSGKILTMVALLEV